MSQLSISFEKIPAEVTTAHILPSLPKQDLLALRLVERQGVHLIDLFLKRYWDALRKSPTSGPVDLPPLLDRIQRDLGGSTYLCFKRLACAFVVAAGVRMVDPVLTYDEVYLLQIESKINLGNALIAIWPKILNHLNIPNPRISTPVEIRDWMNDPFNELLHLMNIESLDLSHLQLRILPPEICKLSGLKRLDVSYNGLVALPDAIGNLSALTHLKVDNSSLKSFLPAINKLAKLGTLDVSTNDYSPIPLEIFMNMKVNGLDGWRLSLNPHT